MAHGTVKFFNVAKGFGFITADEGGKDVFVPAASITAASIPGLNAGQRVSFEAEPDKKGPKAVNLKVLADAPAPTPRAEKVAPAAKEQAKPGLTIYMDPDCDEASDVLAELRDAGHEPHMVDYIATPPTGEELRRLSMLLRDSNQSLVRKYEPLFLELRLDDRFISDTEFWGAIHEHPSLIHGPVVATATRASICRSAESVESFLAAVSTGEAPPVAKPKGLSPRLLQLVAGGAVTPRVVEAVVERPLRKPAENAPEKIAVAEIVPAKAKIVLGPRKTVAAPQAKVETKAVAKTKAVVKAKAPAKKADSKPAKKPERAAKK
ncbi:MAG: arsenate reductase [Pseudomonadota bacterium]